MAKIYVASSWRNEYQTEVVKILRENLHAVYDFRHEGFSWSSVSKTWTKWTVDQYIRALDSFPAVNGFKRDMKAIDWCEVCVYVMPFGQSASMKLGYAKGTGKFCVVYIPKLEKIDLMVKMAHVITKSMTEVLDAIKSFESGHEDR